MKVKNSITVVTGMGRCGSSLLMKMLNQGGLPVFVDPKFHPFFESPLQMALPEKSSWLNECKGAAVKVLFPFCLNLPKGYSYKFIWVLRNSKEQSKSIKKVSNLLFGLLKDKEKTNDPKVDLLKLKSQLVDVSDIERMTFSTLQSLKDYKMPILIINFEDLINHPLESSILISKFLPEHNLNVEEMANVMIQRPVSNYNGFLEDNLAGLINKTTRLMHEYLQ
ncbi:hypothetical protein SAMN04488029_0905 [Reichenbachiella faecimaris]|uniref:Sulfotransferase family protein n=1 Tax=Reichenbachiella faecimaris TaxID=692418 RepID=A0A1W2G896_REIFA|nr:hypothetical protein [Reichenbachiella faecimaris]SMD32558.1 hypothetical protein SAMN04488029_0905 [Reichenbachiella faecimaris]